MRKRGDSRRPAPRPTFPVELAPYFAPISNAPPLGRISGMGSGLYGRLADPRLADCYIAIRFVSIFWLPIIPLAAYLIEQKQGQKLARYRISLASLVIAYRWRSIWLYINALIEGAIWASVFLLAAGMVMLFVIWIKHAIAN